MGIKHERCVTIIPIMPEESDRQTQVSVGQDKVEQYIKGNRAWQPGYNEWYLKWTFEKAFKSGWLQEVIEQAKKHGGVFRTLEIGPNKSASLRDVPEFLTHHLPANLPVQIEFVDANSFKPESIQLPQGLPTNFLLHYYTATEAGAFLSHTPNPYAIIVGYGTEFLIQPDDPFSETQFVETLRKIEPSKLLIPGGLLMFCPGRGESSFGSYSPMLDIANYEELKGVAGTTIIRKKIV